MVFNENEWRFECACASTCVYVCYTYVACTDTVIQCVAQVAHTQKAFLFTYSHSHSHSRILPFPVAWLFPFQVLLGEAFRRVGPLRFTAINWACVCACVWTTSIKQAADNNKLKQSCHFLCHFFYAAAAQSAQQLNKLENARERDYVSVCVWVWIWVRVTTMLVMRATGAARMVTPKRGAAQSRDRERQHSVKVSRLYHNSSPMSRRASDRERVRDRERVSGFNCTACKFSCKVKELQTAHSVTNTHIHFDIWFTITVC